MQMMTHWKRQEKELREAKKKAEKEMLEKRKKEEELREAKRQQRKLNFLLTQTELFSHFIQRKQQPTTTTTATTSTTAQPDTSSAQQSGQPPSALAPANAAESIDIEGVDDEEDAGIHCVFMPCLFALLISHWLIHVCIEIVLSSFCCRRKPNAR
jgi:DNA helicase INO80